MPKKQSFSQETRTVTLTGTGIKKQTFRLREVTDWRVVADVLVPLLVPGTILALSGNLGAGKTTFVQILAERLGSKRIPQSPTFALMRSYPTKSLRLIHVDAYRLEDERELLPLDLDEELADKKSILVLEWPERVEKWLKRHKSVIWLHIFLDEENDIERARVAAQEGKTYSTKEVRKILGLKRL